MRFIFLFVFAFLSFTTTLAQLPYTQNQFQFRTEDDIEYGIAINYAGLPDTLKLDLYKPVNDNNCLRPLLVIIHGGSWIAGTKKDDDVVAVAKQMVAKGYVVASINYRLGTHKATAWTQWAVCNSSLVSPCLYIADSCEVFRAIYRGMQDAKGAIRFLKNRSLLDSTDANNVFVAGTSAGGFISMATAFLDLPGEKPLDCYSTGDAPVPESGIAYCNPKNASLERPDLGDIDGTLNLGGATAKVRGVGCFFGAMPALNWLEGPDTPAIYLFHQQSDVIVGSAHSRVLSRLSYECLGGICQPIYFYPLMYGCESIADSLASMGASAPVYSADIVNNWNGNLNCLQNPPGHAIDNIVLRSQHMADLFAPVIAENGNSPTVNCLTSVTPGIKETSIDIFPNPVYGQKIYLRLKENDQNPVTVSIYDLMGRKISGQVVSEKVKMKTIYLPESLDEGIYFISVITDGKNYSGRFMRSRLR